MQPGTNRLDRARESIAAAVRDGFDAAWRKPSELGWRELGIAALGLFAINFALYWRMVHHSAPIADDWFWFALYKFSNPSLGDILGASNFFSASNYRPGHQVLEWFMNAVADQSHSTRMVIGIAIAGIETTLLYALLRMLGMRILPSAFAAVTLAVLPSLDTTRLAFAGFNETLAGAMYLGGAIAAIRGLRSDGRWSQIAWHAGALALYFASVLTYESFAPLIPLSVLLYWVAAGSLRPALRRWPADLALFILSVLAIKGASEELRGGDTSIGHVVDRIPPVWDALVRVFSYNLPGDSLIRGPLGVVALALVAAGIALAIDRRSELRRPALVWLATAGLAFLFAVAAGAPLLAGQDVLLPAFKGVDNRLNVAPAVGESVLIVALIALAAIGLAELIKRPRWAAPIAAAVLALNCVLLIHKERDNQQPWLEANDWQQRIFAAVDEGIKPEPRPGSAAITFGHPIYVGQVPVFFDFDLGFALRLRHPQMTGTSRPYLSNGTCLDDGYSSGAPNGNPLLPNLDPYAAGLYFVNVPTKQVVTIRNKAQCERELARLVPPVAPAPATFPHGS